MTVAVVDSYDDPCAKSDLNLYRAGMGLPPVDRPGGPTLKKVNQQGGASYPKADPSWAREISLDLDMVSAVCSDCNIMLVEAKSDSLNDLGAAVDYAAHKANVIVNSYGGGEFSSETGLESHYNHPGVAITASSGDSGYGVDYPAASRYVTAVGGTSLSKDSTTARGWSEKVWSGTGSGCSAYVAKPSWQTDKSCSNRTVADVAALADPSTGVLGFDSYQTNGWLVFGGTSVASPVVGSVYALAGNMSSINDGSYPYSHASSLYDVTSGSNGNCAASASAEHAASPTTKKHPKPPSGPPPGPPPGSPPPGPPSPPGSSQSYLCNGVPGYDGPTGNGTPNGTGAF